MSIKTLVYVSILTSSVGILIYSMCISQQGMRLYIPKAIKKKT